MITYTLVCIYIHIHNYTHILVGIHIFFNTICTYTSQIKTHLLGADLLLRGGGVEANLVEEVQGLLGTVPEDQSDPRLELAPPRLRHLKGWCCHLCG